MQRGCLVLDPFVGTGSMLVAAAAVGAVTMGADIDMRVIRLGKVLLAIFSNKTNFFCLEPTVCGMPTVGSPPEIHQSPTRN